MSIFKKVTGLAAFSGAYLSQKLGNGFEAVVEGIVSLDPEGATEAQLDLMQSDLEKATKKFAVLSQEKQKELKEATEALALYETSKKAAHLVAGKIKENPSLADALNPKLLKLIEDAESKKMSYDKEKLEADNITKLVDTLEIIVEQKYEAINKARKALNDAKVQMKMAEAKQETANLAKEIDAMKNGTESTGLNVALKAMQKKTASIEADMAAQEKLDSLKKKSDIFEDDDIKAILQEAEGKPTVSLDDRLSKL